MRDHSGSVSVHIMSSPFGSLTLFAAEGALVALEWGEVAQTNPDPVLLAAERQLNAYFAGDFKPFSVPLNPDGTDFQHEIWREMQKIPAGRTMSYGDLAQAAGHARASRAVGSACARNPLPLFIPCHRVLRADGEVGHYSGGDGAETKRQLLILEGALTL